MYHNDVCRVGPPFGQVVAPFSARQDRVRTRRDPRAHAGVRMGIIRTGTGVVEVEDGSRVAVRPGDVVVVMPMIAVGIIPDGRMTVTWVFLTLDYLIEQATRLRPDALSDHLVARIYAKDYLTSDPVRVVALPPSEITGVHQCGDDLVGLTHSGLIVGNVFLHSQPMMSIFAVVMPLINHPDGCRCGSAEQTGRLSSGSDPQAGLAPAVATALVWIRAHFREAYSLDMLAQAAGLSRRGLTRSFEAQVGKSPQMVRDELRLDEFCRSLVMSTLSIVQAAKRVGWSPDQARRMLLRVTGLTPTQWRADHPCG